MPRLALAAIWAAQALTSLVCPVSEQHEIVKRITGLVKNKGVETNYSQLGGGIQTKRMVIAFSFGLQQSQTV